MSDTNSATHADAPPTEPFRTGFIAIVGRPNVGKSTLVNRLVGQKITITSRKAQTTRHRIHGILTTPDTQYVFVDTPGFQTRFGGALNQVMNRTVTQALGDCDAVLLLLEAGKLTDADRKVIELLPKHRPVLLVVNKTDTVKPREKLVPYLAEVAGLFPFADVVPVSAKAGTQTEALLRALRRHLPEGVAMFDEDTITDRSERFLAAEIIREKVFRASGEEVPYACSVVIDKFEDKPSAKGGLYRIFASIVVDRGGHKPILIGRGGEKLKGIATEARLDMERLFGRKVYLEVFVKVRGGWSDNEAALRKLGYDT
jgi:GTP-binding protein Era